MKIETKTPIAQIASDIPGAMAILESLGVDFATGGAARTLADAAYAEGLDPEVVIRALRGLKPAGEGSTWSDKSLSELVDNLMDQHHHFVRTELTNIALELADLCASPGVSQDVQGLRRRFVILTALLLPHMRDEEQNLFSAIGSLESAWQAGDEPPLPGSLRAHVARMLTEHGMITNELSRIRELRLRLSTDDIAPSLRTTLEALSSFEAHLHEFMFLENCVLFPRAMAMEEQLRIPVRA